MHRSDRWLWAWALGYVAVGAASILVPLYAIAFGAGALLVGAIAATAAFAGVPGALLWGWLAARSRRRRPFLLVALAATAVVLALLPLVGSPLAVLGLNAALWFVVAAAAPVLNLIVVEGRPESEWNDRIAALNAAQGYGWVLGLVAGAAWTGLAPRLTGLSAVGAQRWLFGALAATALAALGLTRLWYPDPASVSPARFRRGYRRLSREGWGAGRFLRTLPYGPGRIYWGLTALAPGGPRALSERYGGALTRYLLAATLFSTGFAVFWGPMPAYLVAVGFDVDAVFALFLVANLGSAVVYAPVGRLATRLGTRRLQLAALAARVGLFPAAAVVGTSLLGLGLVFALIGVTWAVIAVTAAGLVTALASLRVRGEALGVYTALASLGTGAGSALGGAVAASAGYLPAFALASGFVLAGGLLALR